MLETIDLADWVAVSRTYQRGGRGEGRAQRRLYAEQFSSMQSGGSSVGVVRWRQEMDQLCQRSVRVVITAAAGWWMRILVGCDALYGSSEKCLTLEPSQPAASVILSHYCDTRSTSAAVFHHQNHNHSHHKHARSTALPIDSLKSARFYSIAEAHTSLNRPLGPASMADTSH